MKKHIKSLVSILIISIMILAFTGCGSMNKTAINTDTFISTADSKEYEVVDILEQYNEIEAIKNATVAFKSEDGENILYQIEFYELDAADSAMLMFNENKDLFESKTSTAVMETTVNLGNFSKYSVISNGKYMVVSRIDNTLVFVDVDKEYKDTINEFLEAIGY